MVSTTRQIGHGDGERRTSSAVADRPRRSRTIARQLPRDVAPRAGRRALGSPIRRPFARAPRRERAHSDCGRATPLQRWACPRMERVPSVRGRFVRRGGDSSDLWPAVIGGRTRRVGSRRILDRRFTSACGAHHPARTRWFGNRGGETGALRRSTMGGGSGPSCGRSGRSAILARISPAGLRDSVGLGGSRRRRGRLAAEGLAARARARLPRDRLPRRCDGKSDNNAIAAGAPIKHTGAPRGAGGGVDGANRLAGKR